MTALRWLAMLGLALLLAGCSGDGRIGGTLITGGHHALPTGVVLDGHLLMLDGRFDVAEGASISGSAYLVGGDLRLDGRLDGDITVLGGSVEMGPAARVAGDVRLAGGDLRRDPEARIFGSVVTGVDAQAAIGLVGSGQPSLAESSIRFVIQLAGLLVLAALTVRWLDLPAARIGDAVRRRTLLAVSLGVLAVLIGLPLVVFMAFTVVLIPVALLLAAAYGIVLAFAWVALGRELGRALDRWTQRLTSPLAQALAGTALLTTGAALAGLVPLLGDVAIILVLLACIGSAVVTRLGTASAPARSG